MSSKYLMIAILMFAQVVWSGGSEVPWPESQQREVIVKDLQGLWVSQNLDSPKHAFDIKVHQANFDFSCPYVVSISEISPFTGNVQTNDVDVICASFPRKVTFILSDELGQPRHYVEIVGLEKPKEAKEIGRQYLGITVYNYGIIQEKIYEDVFYKLSE